MFRLKELRREYGLKRSDFSKKVGMNAGTIANYENEIREANYSSLIKFAKFFDVSLDYLLGNDENAENGVDATVNDFPRVEPLSINERKILECYKKSSNKSKRRIMEYSELMCECFKDVE